jgi:hypothetical protein
MTRQGVENGTDPIDATTHGFNPSDKPAFSSSLSVERDDREG